MKNLKITKRALFKAISTLIFFLFSLLICSFLWIQNLYRILNLDMIIFHLKVPIANTSPNLVYNFLLWALLPSVILSILFIYRYKITLIIWSAFSALMLYVLDINFKNMSVYQRIADDIKGFYYTSFLYNDDGILLILKAIIFAILITAITYGILKAARYIPKYVIILFVGFITISNYYILDFYLNLKEIFKPKVYSNFYEANYTIPDIDTPSKKRNLIVIFLESLESSFSSYNRGGGEIA